MCWSASEQIKHDSPVALLRLNICRFNDSSEAVNSDRLKL